MNYHQAVRFLDSLVNYEKQARPRDEFKLDNIRRLLDRCGNPQQRLPPTILVAGTKGKGSVCYQLEAALRGCGLATGLFVSPHVLSVRERIGLNGRPISESLFARAVERVAPHVGQLPVSYFEFTTAMAFDSFARLRPDYCIIEVGLGGRLDATNLSDPQVSVITRIGYDHLNVLGRTLPKIAREKAGIMRQDRPVIISQQEPAALRSVVRCARRTGAHLVRADETVTITGLRLTSTGSSFQAHWSSRSPFKHRHATFHLPLLGRHQVENFRTVLTTLLLLAEWDRRITISGIKQGLRSVRIPARCQLVSRQPLTIVDSCHNPESGAALADALRDHLLPFQPSARRSGIVLVYGSLRGKLVLRTVRPLAPLVHQAVLVRPDSPRAMPLALLKSAFTRLGINHTTAADLTTALALARQSSLPIVIAGSFYLAGDALRLLDQN